MNQVSNLQVSLVDSGKHFESLENPLAYSDELSNSSANITVIAPFHSNAYSNQNPTITVTVEKDVNTVLIVPAYDQNMALSNIYTQIIKYSFTLSALALQRDGTADIAIIVDEKGKPDTISEPKRKTKILVPPQN